MVMTAQRWSRGTLGTRASGERGASARRQAGNVVSSFLLVLFCVGSMPASADTHRRFLLIYSAHSTLVANVEVTAGIFSVFDEALGADYEAYAEYRDDQRFPGPEADRAFLREMGVKYRGKPFDGILVLGPFALQFALEHRADLDLDAVVVAGGITHATLEGIDLAPEVHAVVSDFSVPGTLALARKLQPTAERVVVMTGSAAFDRSWRDRARRELAGERGIAIDYVSDLTIAGFEDAAAAFDRDTILMILSIFEDADGAQFTPVNAAERIAARSAAPAYAVYDTYIGRGVVGGEVQRFRDVGAAMAEAVLRLANGETVERLSEPAARPVVDWRQMERFGLDRRLLPANAVLEFHDPSIWERYRTQILLAATIILIQSATIAGLVVQGRRRRSAEREMAARRVELAHMSRVVQLGELSGAVAHELNQPLTSILANAEAGAQLIARDPVDLGEIAAILADIAEDDRRAAGIIVELRRLMARDEAQFEQVDLNDVALATARLLQSELLVREVAVETELFPGALPVRGSRAQLKQVLQNLMLNAADAMADQPPGTRRMTVTSELRADGWRELAVRDNGPGLAAEIADDPFRPFATTKATGLGLGLSICRTIAKAHGGGLAFDETVDRGARAVLTLPSP